VKSRLLTALVIALFSHSKGEAQELASLFPPGGQRGSTVDVALEGKNLADAHSLFFSQPGLVATKDGTRFRVAIAETAAEGDCDVWVATTKGLSNPRRFAVGTLPEINEKEPNDDPKVAQAITFPIVINGVLTLGMDRDWFRFDAEKGQRISMQFRSETLDGSARPALTLIAPSGKEVLHDDGRDAEPTLDFEALETGSHVLKVEERTYLKGDNHVYRLAIFSGPRLLGAFPQMLTRGQTQPVTLYGYRLPGGMAMGPGFPPDLQQIQADIAAPQVGAEDGGGWLSAAASTLQGFRYRHPHVHGDLRFGLTDGPVTLETTANHAAPKQSQPLPFPCTLAGRFLQPREIDWYRLPLKKDQLIWIEAAGDREGRAIDLEVTVHDAKSNPLSTLAPYVVKKGDPEPVPLRSLDPMGLFKATEVGDHYLVIRDLYGTTRSGVNRTYNLMIGKRREEVCVMTVPATQVGWSAPPGGSISVPVAALRRGGHEGPIRIRAEGLPTGLEMKDTVIPAKQLTANCVLNVAKDAPAWVGRLTLLAETEIDGKQQTLPVVGLAIVRPGSLRRCALVSSISR